MQKIGAAIWGAGWVAGEHARAWMNNPHCELVAIGSRRRSSAERLASKLGVEATLYANEEDPWKAYDELLNDPRVAVLSICTPHHLHAEAGVRAAQAGKHFFIEKPIALNKEDLVRLRDAVRSAKVKTIVGFVLRWNPFFESVKALIQKGALGRLYYAEVDYWSHIDEWWSGFQWAVKKESGGSAFLTAGCHAIDAIRWFMEDEVTEVTAYSTQWDFRWEFPPTIVGILKFTRGAIGKSCTSIECRMPYNFNVDLLGTEGTVRYNGEEAGRVWSDVLFPNQTGWTQIHTILPDTAEVTHHPFQAQINHFVNCILEDKESHCNVEDAVKTHEICLALDQSAETGQPVRLPLID
ncbi:MAG: Gfo/Idh/MocA family oxidoreductase [Armatimonadetes bacterium]|nr:Gfo/Idh/MocA family oxidoreductase [Armatimonadota bacterium]MDW8121785.1 Gfo/Idh/MocA family oxidoreductase [Armatimonadota bacterium]